MQIYDKPLGWLTPYENNPRNNDEAVEPVANSISEFGFKVPIYYGMELDPVYVERTIKRWEEETGLKAEKIN